MQNLIPAWTPSTLHTENRCFERRARWHNMRLESQWGRYRATGPTIALPGPASAYSDFLRGKQLTVKPVGIAVDASAISPLMFPFQRDIALWILRKGRGAVFCDTGLGKTVIQLEIGKQIAKRGLILAPLGVARQTVKLGAKFGYDVTYAREQSQAPREGLTITNYEMVGKFDPDQFDTVLVDEASILKNFEGAIRNQIIDMFKDTPSRFAFTATPAPNDIQEFANHAEFLGIMSRVEMLAKFFVHDDEGWRIKGHARTAFYRWLASWSITMKKPSDLGYSDEGYDLPPLNVIPNIIDYRYVRPGMLISTGLEGITDRSKVQRETADIRVARTAEIANSTTDQVLVWCYLNEESTALAKAIPDAIEVTGSQSPDEKAELIERFVNGDARVLVTKPKIAGFGLNLQNCHNMIFCGINDSYEGYYQPIRREWRFGQKHPVNVHIVIAEPQMAVYENVMRKEREAETTSHELIKAMVEFERAELRGSEMETFTYEEKEASGNSWRMLLGDSAERMKELADESVDLAVFSQPFASLYTYSPTERDLGNSDTPEQFWQHFGFITQELYRVIKPGRNVAAHVQQLSATIATHGYMGMIDFRGQTIAHFQKQGFIYYGEVCIDKNPQAQAIRTHSKGLLFNQFHKDSTWSRPALADYILIFKKPGENAVPVIPELTNEEWIEYAHPVWYNIRESDTLNVAEGRTNEDERHICALQLGTIERCIKLWSNPGETVFSPFGGIGSEPYTAVKFGRKGLAIELKPEYFKVAVNNLKRAEAESQQVDLFAFAGVQV